MATTSPPSPDTKSVEISTILSDFEQWHVRGMTRMFYPNTAASISIAVPDTIVAFHKKLPDMTFIPTDIRDTFQKTILTFRDSIATLVAEGVSGKTPEYKGFIQFQKNYTDIIHLLRSVQTLALAAQHSGGTTDGKGPSNPSPPLGTSASDPLSAFTSARHALSDDTPLKRYVRGLKHHRNGHKE